MSHNSHTHTHIYSQMLQKLSFMLFSFPRQIHTRKACYQRRGEQEEQEDHLFLTSDYIRNSSLEKNSKTLRLGWLNEH